MDTDRDRRTYNSLEKALSLIVLSPCFYPDASPAELMVKSAEANGLEVKLYGIGEGFIPHGAHAQVFQLFTLMKQQQLADYVLVADCRDVLIVAGEEEIIRKFHSFRSPLVMSTERGCWPPDPDIAQFFYGKDKHGYDYINAGVYIGEWNYVARCLEFLLAKYRGTHPGADNSQGWWMYAKMRGELLFDLDSSCQIFQSMSGGCDGHIAVENLQVRNTVTNTLPCVIHFNGNPGVFNPHAELYRRIFNGKAVGSQRW